jgi:hypothetical protein
MRYLRVAGAILVVSGCFAEEVQPTETNGPVGTQVENGLFVLSVASPWTAYLAGAPLQIQAELTYVGAAAEAQVEGSRDVIGWRIEQVDGTPHLELAPVALCDKWTMRRGEPLVRTLPTSPSWRLPPGTWRILATSNVGVDRSAGGQNRECDDDLDLKAEIVITTR